ncbi:MAG: hypothetical protein AAFX81_11470 [Pseudomonadota bacterium]
MALLAAGGLGACGFEPVYGRLDDDGALAAELRAISLPDAVDRISFEFRSALADQLSPTRRRDVPRYALSYQLTRYVQDLAVQLDATVTRKDLVLIVVYQMVDLAENRVVDRGQIQRLASFNISGEPFGDQVAEEDAERRAAGAAAVAVRQLLVAHFRRRAAAT